MSSQGGANKPLQYCSGWWGDKDECEERGNPIGCCVRPIDNKKMICSDTNGFTAAPTIDDFSDCTAECPPRAPPGPQAKVVQASYSAPEVLPVGTTAKQLQDDPTYKGAKRKALATTLNVSPEDVDVVHSLLFGPKVLTRFEIAAKNQGTADALVTKLGDPQTSASLKTETNKAMTEATWPQDSAFKNAPPTMEQPIIFTPVVVQAPTPFPVPTPDETGTTMNDTMDPNGTDENNTNNTEADGAQGAQAIISICVVASVAAAWV